ncbi:hypothetical protein DL96DRAFT_1554547 [Flagelloscypha sp. PMI_526]|nr:hypothetical protein DL96DRAFT_1554547 [Flagelloscypha sp. PMI_526]
MLRAEYLVKRMGHGGTKMMEELSGDATRLGDSLYLVFLVLMPALASTCASPRRKSTRKQPPRPDNEIPSQDRLLYDIHGKTFDDGNGQPVKRWSIQGLYLYETGIRDGTVPDDPRPGDRENIPEQARSPHRDARKENREPVVLDIDDEDDVPATTKIDYDIRIFAAKERRKQWSNRKTSRRHTLTLSADLPMDTFIAKVLVQVDKAFKPKKIDQEHYEWEYGIPYKAPGPNELSMEEDYREMVKMALEARSKSKKKDNLPGTATVYILQKNAKNEEKKKRRKHGSSSESSTDDSDDLVGKPKSKKSKKTNEQNETQLDNQTVEKMELIRQRWTCTTHDRVCYFSAEDLTHVPITNEMQRIWAINILSDTASIERPPNNHHFDMIPARSRSEKTNPVLSARRNALLKDAASAPAATLPPIHVNVNTGVPAGQPSPLGTGPPSQLLPASRRAGPDMTVSEFCQKYSLSSAVHDKLIANGYERAKPLRHATTSDLREMGLLFGEISSLRDAVEDWSVED